MWEKVCKHSVLFMAVPYNKEDVALALESGVDGLIVEKEKLASAKVLARCRVLEIESIQQIQLQKNADEVNATKYLNSGTFVLLAKKWEIIPVENLLAQKQHSTSWGELALEVTTSEEAKCAVGILEVGVDTVVVMPQNVLKIKEIVATVKETTAAVELVEATITEITPVGMGHRVCVDTLSVFKKGQGMLVGNSAAFTFLVNAETEHNEYVASRPFRINAGAVHAYAVMPHDKTVYLEELTSGSEVLIVDEKGQTSTAVVGRAKVERRPMLLVRAEVKGTVLEETVQKGAVFLQNAETIRLITAKGEAISVVELAVGDKVLCRLDVAGRHFGIRISEDITEF